MPIGAIAGIPRFMDGLDGGMWQYGDDSIPEIGVTYFAGTFVRHPVALAAARAALVYLKEKGPALQRELNARTDRFVRELNEHFERVGAPVHIASFGSLFEIHVDETLPLGSLFFHALRVRGVHLWEGRPELPHGRARRRDGRAAHAGPSRTPSQRRNRTSSSRRRPPTAPP